MFEKLIGKRIKLVHTNDQYTKLKTGDLGTIVDINQVRIAIKPWIHIWVKWDNGSNLALIYGIDQYEVL